MLPQQVGVGVKYAAEHLVMDLRMTLHENEDFIIISTDISNAYCELMRASVVDMHMDSEKMRGMVPYWRAKLGPNAKLWAGEDYMEYMEGLVQGSPTSSSGFSFTIHDKVKEADKRLAEYGGCARFGMDDEYLIGPTEGDHLRGPCRIRGGHRARSRMRVEHEEMQDVQPDGRSARSSEKRRIYTGSN